MNVFTTQELIWFGITTNTEQCVAGSPTMRPGIPSHIYHDLSIRLISISSLMYVLCSATYFTHYQYYRLKNILDMNSNQRKGAQHEMAIPGAIPAIPVSIWNYWTTSDSLNGNNNHKYNTNDTNGVVLVWHWSLSDRIISSIAQMSHSVLLSSGGAVEYGVPPLPTTNDAEPLSAIDTMLISKFSFHCFTRSVCALMLSTCLTFSRFGQ